MSQKPTRKRRTRKAADRPSKPYPDFPLTPHASGKWQKKIRGKVHYFGRWARMERGKLVRVENDGWEEALRLYKAQADDLHAGRTPRVDNTGGGLTVRDLCNAFGVAKQRKLKAGELSQRTLAEYREFCDVIVATFGKDRLVDDLAAGDFAELRAGMAEKWGPARLSKAITCIKGVFKFAFDNGLIDRPVRYGSEFQKPGKAVMRRHKASGGEKMFEATEVKRILVECDAPMRAMTLLALNCGFGNTDVADLRQPNIRDGWIVYPRGKTGIERRCPLWPETIEALKAAIAARPEPKDKADADCVFLTSKRERWVHVTQTRRYDNVTTSFRRLLRRLGINGRRGLGFYSLRHTHRTIAGGARDPEAANALMGHAQEGMAAHYIQRIDDARLEAVAGHVRAWLWPAEAEEQPTEIQSLKVVG